jgi:transcriptional regulator with XRE-family HTH domain
MVRQPLTAEQVAAGRRLGVALRAARAGRSLIDVALAAGMSPETLRKIEAGRLPAPAFGTVVCLSQALDVPLNDLAEVWLTGTPSHPAQPEPTSAVDHRHTVPFNTLRNTA